jgi:hypothetical protein
MKQRSWPSLKAAVECASVEGGGGGRSDNQRRVINRVPFVDEKFEKKTESRWEQEN